MAKAPYTARPQHYGRQQLRALGLLSVSGAAVIAAAVVARVLRNRRNTSAGSYVLVDEAGRVFVLAEAAASTEAVVRRHEGWLIGLYGGGAPFVPPRACDVESDIRAAMEPSRRRSTPRPLNSDAVDA